MKELTGKDFDDEVLASTVPVVVDFWAPWCPPCVMIAPILDELSKKFDGRLKIVKVNIEDETTLAERFGVRSIPNLLFFKDGELVKSSVGTMPKAKFDAMFEEFTK